MPCFSHPPSSRPSHSAYCLSRASAGIRLAPDPMRCQARPAAVRLRHRGGRGQAREEDASHDAGGCRARGETVAVIVCVVERSPAASAASATPSPPSPQTASHLPPPQLLLSQQTRQLCQMADRQASRDRWRGMPSYDKISRPFKIVTRKYRFAEGFGTEEFNGRS